jgi:DUF971 family protein
MTAARAWPTELTFRREDRALRVAFDSGEAFDIPFELLRVLSPSAEVRGHRSGDEKLIAGKSGVGVRGAEPVGRYAVRIIFDDGHDSGLYTWDYLHELGRDRAAHMAKYEAALARAGLAR